MKLEHDSFDGNPGKTIGDDTCAKLVKLGIKRLPPNKRFKKGVPVRTSLILSLIIIFILIEHDCYFLCNNCLLILDWILLQHLHRQKLVRHWAQIASKSLLCWKP